MPVYRVLIPVLLLLPSATTTQAGLADLLDIFTGSGTGSNEPAGQAQVIGGAPSNAEMIAALREALDAGTRFAVDSLGREGGFLDNARVRIPMPASLAWLEKTLRTLGQQRLADEFVTSMNRAAERAVPAAADIFADAIRTMTLEDAQGILSGPDDAATRYFVTKPVRRWLRNCGRS